MSDIAYKAMTYAIAVNEANAKMFRIVACPTAGSCGVMPGAVKAVADHYKLDRATMVKGLSWAGLWHWQCRSESRLCGRCRLAVVKQKLVRPLVWLPVPL